MSDPLDRGGDDTTNVLRDGPAVVEVGDVAYVMSAVVHPWMMNGAEMRDAEVVKYVRHWWNYCIDGNRVVGTMMTAYLDGVHHQTELENPRIVVVEVHDDDDHDIDDHNHHDMVVQVLQDDDDHIQHIRRHYQDHHEDGTRSQHFLLLAIH